jgi:hypothetical protein
MDSAAMMTKRRSILLGIFLTISFITGIRTNAQDNPNYWVYQIVETETAFDVTRTNAQDGRVETVTTVPKTPDFNLLSIMPPEEFAVADDFLADSLYMNNPDFSPRTFFDRPPDSFLRHIAVSPDGETIAMVVVHWIYALYPRMECFGVSQIVLVSVHTGEQQILWTLPLQAHNLYSLFCGQFNDSMTEKYLQDLRWTPDQEALVVSIYYDRMDWYRNLVMIPVANPENAFYVGNGVWGWAIAPDRREIITLSHRCGTKQEQAYNITTFDLDAGVISNNEYPLGTLQVNRWPGAAYFRQNPIFIINQDTSRPEYDLGGGGITFIDPDQPDRLPLFNLAIVIGGYVELRSSLSSEVAVIQGEDDRLWRLILEQDTLKVLPLTNTPVTYWQFAGDAELVVQFAGDTRYTIIAIPSQSNG